jgi:hypothetical protein
MQREFVGIFNIGIEKSSGTLQKISPTGVIKGMAMAGKERESDNCRFFGNGFSD